MLEALVYVFVPALGDHVQRVIHDLPLAVPTFTQAMGHTVLSSSRGFKSSIGASAVFAEQTRVGPSFFKLRPKEMDVLSVLESS